MEHINKIGYEVSNSDSILGNGHVIRTRFANKKEAFEFAKVVAKQDAFSEAFMTKIVWNNGQVIEKRTCIVKADGSWKMI